MKDVIFNPVFNDICTFIKTSQQTKGSYSEMEVVLGSKGKNPLHKHSAFTETFTTIEGQLGLTLNGQDIRLSPGESITIQRGDIHNFFNPTDEPCKFRCVFTPGNTGAENMLRIVYGLAADGKSGSNGIPADVTTIAILSEMGNTELTGLLFWLTPVLKWLAKRGRKKGIERNLLNTYCRPVSFILRHLSDDTKN